MVESFDIQYLNKQHIKRIIQSQENINKEVVYILDFIDGIDVFNNVREVINEFVRFMEELDSILDIYDYDDILKKYDEGGKLFNTVDDLFKHNAAAIEAAREEFFLDLSGPYYDSVGTYADEIDELEVYFLDESEVEGTRKFCDQVTDKLLTKIERMTKEFHFLSSIIDTREIYSTRSSFYKSVYDEIDPYRYKGID